VIVTVSPPQSLISASNLSVCPPLRKYTSTDEPDDESTLARQPVAEWTPATLIVPELTVAIVTDPAVLARKVVGLFGSG
jgi:hypothetical protein